MANTTARTRKAVAATKTATANITAARKAVAKKTAAAPVGDKPKKEQTFEERDWTYLDDKPPSEQHEILAKEINRRTNLVDDDGEDTPISPKQVQAVLAMFPHFQRSATNKARAGYHPLAAEIVEKRSEHMTLAHKEAREIMDGLAQEVAKKAPAKKTATPKANPAGAAKAVAKRAASPKLNTETRPSTPANPAPTAPLPHNGKAPARKARVTKKTAAPVPASLASSNEAF
jgi:hypothetical protein